MHPNDGRVVSNFIMQALNGDPITIYGDGTQTRSFCYVSDIIEGLMRFMSLDLDEPGPLNLGNPYEFKILDLAKKIIDLTNSSSKIVYKPLPTDDPRQRKPVINKAEEIIKWTPIIDLDEGLIKTISYFKNNLNSNN